MNIKVGVTDAFRLETDFEPERKFLAAQGASLAVYNCKTQEDILEQMGDCQIHMTVAGPYTKQVLEGLPGLRGIVRYGIGLDTIDLTSATALGVPVCNEPAYCVEDVATHAFALIMDIARKLTFYTTQVRRGNWGFTRGYTARRMQNRTVGLIGFGAIARRLKELLEPFGMEFLVYDPFVEGSAVEALGARQVELEELLGKADIISVHCPLTPETHHLLSGPQFQAMQPHALLVNTSRGPVIDTVALAEAITGGQLAAAGLDVLEEEPIPTDHPLCGLSQVVLTPHAAHYTQEAFLALRESVVSQAAQLIRGERPAYLFNKEVWKG